ncbi:acetoacetate--CoA ligase [Oharaeibacter diazotrophicus]|uniref:Acetoacetyl-CoA synthetase n=1 Tax=Oharaeibacter diazotrophicus TaxID=1920512 RepID=A0A4R6RIQ7_9HYPH|nr:acetoacetate--CoA ligase [Oharaeibacter diazotrophicus]TDP86272.1 acetoacetyl-CoA synthetase [Oharaeibacter diazotrophicus]BBE71787.1 acetyl-coenzyme A synthetase [Pleomorphomonas sp. SM30]GLS78552.1 acetoacetate-CoA ligase [Oharaeibacter diazotrophicus]
MAELLWSPSPERAAATAMTAFRGFCAERFGIPLSDGVALHAWSIAEPAAFWEAVWDFCGVVGDKGERRLVDGDRMPGARFFPDATLNFAENLLARPGAPEDDAVVFRAEDKATGRLSWGDLAALVSRLQQALVAAGVGVGDRVAGLLPNVPEAVAAMLAASSIGAVWSSASPDFGPRGVLDRFGQIEPKVLFTVDGYWYAGKRCPIGDKLGEIVPQLPSARTVVVLDILGEAETLATGLPRATTLPAFLAPFEARRPKFERLPFDHPLYILYSSGTTGVPKCIVHRAGGVLLQHLKEHALHADTRPGDRVFYFTTLGWMMWNWLVSALSRGATLLLYDGSPFHPGPEVLFDYADAEGTTLFGTSAKYIDAVKKSGLVPRERFRLGTVRALASTGSPLAPESFDFVYRDIKTDLHLASISGGTDIVSSFVLGDPTRPVFKGEIQGPGLGMAVEVWTDDGRRAPVGEKGELVCVKPFPTMPLGFWNDPDGAKYRAAYFERFPGVWCHGDFAETTAHGGLVIHGRSDATLNPGGVRIGTAEIYAEVEQIPEVVEALAIGQDFAGDVRVILFVRLAPGATLDAALDRRIRERIRAGASPRHVPAKIVAVADIPRTKSGKITELAVRDVVAGRTVKNREALANPEALELFRDLPELAT